MQEGTPAEFDAYDQSYSHIVNRALAFSGMKVDFFARAKVDYFVELIGSLPLPATRCEVIDVGSGVANSHPLFAGRIGRLAGVDVSQACIAKAAALIRKTSIGPTMGSTCPIPMQASMRRPRFAYFTTFQSHSE